MGRLANFKNLVLPIILLGLVLVWASGGWGQTLEGFPKIIFTDPYWVQVAFEDWWHHWENPGEINFENYWGQIDSCGINLDATWGDELSLNNPFGIKILNHNLFQVVDDDFPWTDQYALSPNTASVWLFADGLWNEYDVGEYGGRFDCPPATGEQYQIPGSDPPHYVYRALVSQDTAGPLLEGTFDQCDQFRYRPYYVTFRMKMVGDNLEHIEVAEAKLWCTRAAELEDDPHSQLLYSEPDTGVTQTEMVTIPIYADDFQSPGSYENITLPNWVVLQGNKYETHLVLDWLDERDLYVDNVIVRDIYYYRLKEYAGGGYYDQAIKDSLLATFNINPALNFRWYKDEPRPNMLKSFRYVDSLAREAGTVPLNGYYPRPSIYVDFIAQIHPKELITGYYPIFTDTDSSSDSGGRTIQDAWDEMISIRMKPAILAANSDPANPDDDIPFWMTIQTCDYWKGWSNQVWRNPTPNELKAEVWLSLCYGAKGIMYFVYPTIDSRKYQGSYYGRKFGGLVDLVDANGQPTSDPTIGHFRKNYKWYVVRDMNAVLDSLNPVIQGLTWVDAGKWDEVSSLSGSYITSVTSDRFPQDSVWVEVGLFQDNLYDYFMLVNRRCLSTETQQVTVELSLPPGECYTIKDMYAGAETILFSGSGSASFTTTLEPGQGKLFRLRQGAYLTTQHTWSGTDTVYCDLTIAPSGVLTIQPGATLKFASGAKLTVQGALVAEGTDAAGVTFTAVNPSQRWGGIEFTDESEDSNCVLSHCVIEYATRGIDCSNASPEIDYNLIQDCSNEGIRCTQGVPLITNNTVKYCLNGAEICASSPQLVGNHFVHNDLNGIELFNSYDPLDIIHDNHFSSNGSWGMWLDGGASPTIYRCAVEDNDDIGIVCMNHSSPDMDSCLVSGNGGSGVYCGGSSSPILAYRPRIAGYPEGGYNQIINNGGCGVYACSNSYPDLGSHRKSTPVYPGNNSIYDNGSYEVSNADSGDWIWAQYNYWGLPLFHHPDSSDFFGQVIWEPYLTSDPNQTRIPDVLGEGSEPSPESSDPAEDYTLTAEGLEAQCLYEEAMEAYKQVISQYPASRQARWALDRVILCYQNLEREAEIIPYLEGVADKCADRGLRGLALEQSVYFLQRRGEYRKALSRCDYLMQNYEDSTMGENLLFQKGLIYRYNLRDGRKAGMVFSQFLRDYPYSIRRPMVEVMLGQSIPPPQPKRTAGKDQVPGEFSLGQNYPNPFNPTTTIRYALPEDCWVKLEVYNILGRKVAELVNGFEKAGYKTVRWDARQLASGIYLYRIKAGNYTKVREMILIR